MSYIDYTVKRKIFKCGIRNFIIPGGLTFFFRFLMIVLLTIGWIVMEGGFITGFGQGIAKSFTDLGEKILASKVWRRRKLAIIRSGQSIGLIFICICSTIVCSQEDL